jgi:hypothetical protein
MKKLFFTVILILLLTLGYLIIVLSTKGYETNKFNEIISKQIIKNNQSISLKLEKIKFKIDVKDLSLFLETENPELYYQNINIPIKSIKVYLDFISLIKSKPKIDSANIVSEEINIDQLKKIINKTKPSNLNSLINNKIKSGKLLSNFELYFDENLKIENYIARGEVKDMHAIINSDLILRETSFNFFSDNTDTLIKNIKSKMSGVLLKNGNVQIDRNKKISIKTDFNTELSINNENIKNYSPYLKDIKYINQNTNLTANINHNLNINFDKTYKVTNYIYNAKGIINKFKLIPKKSLKSIFLKEEITNLILKDSDFKVRYSSDKKNFFKSSGSYSLNNKDYHNYEFTNNLLGHISNIEMNFEFAHKFNIDLLNYKKDENKVAKISTNLIIDKDLINFKTINYQENKNLISIEKMKINKKLFISLKKIKVLTYKKNKLNNDFILDFKKKIIVKGKKYDAKKLNKLLKQNTNNSFLKKISSDIEINLENIETTLSQKLKNFKLIGIIEKGKFIKISSKGDFGNNKFLDISMKSDKKKQKKYLEIYSDLPQPLLSEYSFFKGLSGGNLLFSSIIEGDSSASRITIENFKIINAPGVVKLLSLADFGGLADITQGEGLSFNKLEIKINNNKNFLKLEELYAVGPSISVLMDGFKDESNLTSLRGTLVPAKNLNKLLSKIPVIGNIIIPKEVGEGLFGVSFKMKGPPGNIKTTINPIKTLTPRFITRALEKSK